MDLNVLRLLLTMKESQQFLADLESRIKRGEIDEARRLLLGMQEAGTIASLMMNPIMSPRLLDFLQTVVKPPPSAGTTAGAALAENASAETRRKDLEKALESETNRANAAVRELDAHRVDLAARDAKDVSRTADRGDGGLSEALTREKGRAEAAVADLARLKSEQTKLLAKSAELERAVKREKKRADAAARELAALKQEPGPPVTPAASQGLVPAPATPGPQEPSAVPWGRTSGSVERSSKPAAGLSPSGGRDVASNRASQRISPKVLPAESATARNAGAGDGRGRGEASAPRQELGRYQGTPAPRQ